MLIDSTAPMPDHPRMPPTLPTRTKGAATKRKPLTAEEKATAARLKAAFKAAQQRDPSLTQERLAAEFGITQGAISQFFRGIVPVPLERLIDLAPALGVQLRDLSPGAAAKLTLIAAQEEQTYRASTVPLWGGLSASTMQRLAALPQASVDMLEVFLLERIEMFERIQSSKDRAAS